MDIKILNYEDPQARQCQQIRYTVFVKEQNVPEAREQDGLDPAARHYLFLHENKPIGTARSRLEGKKIKIERFAFLPEARGLGLGAQAFQAIIDDCLQSYPSCPIWIGAQAYLRAFYERLGFQAEGDLFQDAGIEHVMMVYTKNQ